MNNKKNVLVFSIALNGYQNLYKLNFVSHANYAQKHRYHYCCVKKPKLTLLGMECAWLKVSLIIRALAAGFKWVMFLDADTKVSNTTPAVDLVEKADKYLYAAKGFSGRLNSGVLIIKNHTSVRAYFSRCLAAASTPVPSEDDVGWGENGHLIYFAKSSPLVHYISRKWNNNLDPYLDDYIRHFSYGPLHDEFKAPMRDKLSYLYWHYCLATWKTAFRLVVVLSPTSTDSFESRLDKLSQQVCMQYQIFNGAD